MPALLGVIWKLSAISSSEALSPVPTDASTSIVRAVKEASLIRSVMVGTYSEPQLFSGGKPPVQRLLPQFEIQLRVGGIVVGLYEQNSDAEGQGTQQIPSYEREVQDENVEL